MSILFMGFSMAVYATHRNWRAEAVDTKALAVKQASENDQLKNKITDLQQSIAHERASRASALAALESRRVELIAERDEAEAAERNARLEASERVAALTVAENTLKVLTDENKVLRTDIASAIEKRDSIFSMVVQLTDKLGQAEGTLDSLKAYRSQLIAQISRFKLVLDRHSLNGDAQVYGIPPRLEGVVKIVNQGLIEVSLGYDEGLREGHTVEIYRGSKYLGRAIVRKTEPDKAVAEILKGYLKGSIQEGDKVATRTKIS